MTDTVPDFINIDNLADYLTDYQQQADVVLLDVRDKASFDRYHLPNAVWMPPNRLAAEINEMDHEKHYIIICYHGVMAISVMNFMRDYHCKASVLQGGMATVRQ